MTTPLRREDWAHLLPLLEQALDFDDPAGLRRWLQDLPEPGRRQVQALLDERAAIETSDFMQRPAALRVSLPAEVRACRETAWCSGDRIGPWELIEHLGSGGMAVVWRARRADGQFERDVALKLPWPGLLPALGARLARERRILAQLQHPNIAQIIDAGQDTSHHGAQPWLALELVQGRPITEHAQGLALRTRLRLFVDVLRAVAHAHAQLVVHRDLKPANVFVTDAGQVKLLDFGVAKLLQSADEAAASTRLTQEAGRALTPQYASPEQIAGLPLSTRSDVYSLGVLLYELLTGRLPYVLRRGSAAELEEAVLTADIRRPSQALAMAQRAAEARALQGDIDTLVLKALARQPAERYASADAFADDIERHLAGQPIQAHPPSWHYRAAKLWARQRLALSAATLASAAVLAGLGWALAERSRAQAEARRAEAVQAFLATTLGAHDPEVARGRTPSARELLDRGAVRIDTDFAATPDVRLRLHAQVATLYSRMGEMAASLRHADAAIAEAKSLGEAGSLAHLEMLFLRHEALIDLARWDEARAAAEAALALAERHAGDSNRWAGRLLSGLSWVALEQGRWAEAMTLAERATAVQLAYSGESSPEALHTLNNEAIVAQRTGRLARAVALQRRIAALGARTPGHLTTDSLVEQTNLHGALLHWGDSAAALPGLEQAWPAMRQHLGARHDRVLAQSLTLAQARAEQGRFTDAEALLRENLAIAESKGEQGHEQPQLLQAALARVLTMAARPADALPLAQQAAQQLAQRLPQPTWAQVRARWFEAEALIGIGQVQTGLALLAQARADLALLAPDAGHPAHAMAALVQAVAMRLESPAQAAALAAKSCAQLVALGEDGARRLPRCRAIQAWLGALAASDDTLDLALARFREQRAAAVAELPTGHLLRAQLQAAEAELLARRPDANAQRADLLREADRAHRAATGRPLPQPLRLVN